ncbi:MAG: site-specific DNA-methyltransferase [Myxococcota bacterium]
MADSWEVRTGEALAEIARVPSDSVDCCVTSPPYWRMRDYGHPEQLGLEDDVADFIGRLADIFDEVRRVLTPAGTCWVNIGDGYTRAGGGRDKGCDMGRRYLGTPGRTSPGLKAGDLVGVPWMLAFELRARGWYLRGEQIWAKTNPIPDGARSRPGRSHEHVFLLTKQASPNYVYNEHAVRTELAPKTLTTVGTERRPTGTDGSNNVRAFKYSKERRHRVDEKGRPVGASLRSVWAMASNSNRARIGHFAMMPHRLARVCVLAGSDPGGLVLDPFCGAGTVGVVALRAGRRFLGLELVEDSAALAREQIQLDAPLLNRAASEGDRV